MVTTTPLLDPMPAGTTGAPHGRCHATARSGSPCRQPAVAGATVCRFHGGSAPQVQRAAARRLAEADAAAVLKLADVEVTAIDDPLSKLAEVAAMAAAWMDHIAPKLDDLESWTGHNDAGTEHIRAMVALFERAMDRCAKLLADWVRLGFDERMVALHEHQTDLVERYVLAVVADLELTDVQRAAVPDAAVRHLSLLTGGQAAA
jgi:hypothetical protein